jgi:methylglutaconyl-CoA hydratase
LNRPEKRNALSPELIQELKDAFTKAESDENVKVIVLRANGDVFCAGADLAYVQQLQNFSYEENLADSRSLKELFLQIYSLSKVVIAKVQGQALAGGCGLITVCDYCFATEEAKFGYTEVKIGFVPAIVMPFLVRKVGEGNARHMLLMGSQITAKEAYTMNLINCVSHKRAIELDVLKLAEYLVRSNSAYSMMLTKKMLATVNDQPLVETLEQAAQLNAKARASDDCKKGIEAFLKKEKINWS